MSHEEAIVFDCEGDPLLGILHIPVTPPTTGIMMIVGGPQYRVGSHRQFVEFARAQSDRGRAVMRFDYRGMGDSGGPYLDFEQVQIDIERAMQEFCQRVPGMTSVIWIGLCDSAAASLMYVPNDKKVRGLVLLNPWVRNAQTQAKAVVKHYYKQRLFSAAFWRKLLSGQANLSGSIWSFLSNLRQSMSKKEAEPENFIARMLAGARRFKGKVLVVLSADDLTANEFKELIKQSSEWQVATSTPKWTWRSLPTANHTFSNYKEKEQVIELCSTWMKDL